jgi:hypothetical protein
MIVNRNKFRELSELISCSKISDLGCAEIATIQGEKYVVTAAEGSGAHSRLSGMPWQKLTAYRVVRDFVYQGEIEPMRYPQHDEARRTGARPPGYDGVLIKSSGIDYVITGDPITVLFSSEELEQTKLFTV